MPVAINFKICDNAAECNGRAACRFGAIGWDEENKTLVVDNKKCISCGVCEKVCGVHAIRVAKTEEYSRILKEIEEDPRRQTDLFVDRYGATPLRDDYLTDEENFQQEVVNYPRLVAVELFKDETIECLLKSIPIKELFDNRFTRYRKMRIESDVFMKKWKIVKLPAILVFNKGKLAGKIEGYFDESRKEELRGKVEKMAGLTGIRG